MTELSEFLVDRGLVSASDMAKATSAETNNGERLTAVLRNMGILQGSELAKALADYFDVPVVEPDEWPSEAIASTRMSTAFLRTSRVFPLGESDRGITLAMADPGDSFALRAVRLATSRPVTPKVAAGEDIDAAIAKIADKAAPEEWSSAGPESEPADDVQHLRDLALGTPIVRLVNQLLHDAVYARATDIHIEPFENRLQIRMRIDGMLRETATPPVRMAKAVASRIKILAGLNIAERRLPQDGRARVRIDSRQLDLRIATMPTIHGETVAIRLLDNVRRTLDLAKLGFRAENEALLRASLDAPYGLIVVTGPTGSGKTTTLASALSILGRTERKILTIEDPIEYELEGINQTQAKPDIGLTFAASLRSFLRHDPDVIMVGEMRDSETAQIGIDAALTGHLVLTSLHTNTAAGAITRLLDMGVDAYLLASSLRCVVAQRLVRVLCTNCRVERTGRLDLPGAALTGAGIAGDSDMTLWQPGGCERCGHTGYRERVAITEVLDVGENIRSLIRPGISTGEIEHAGRAAGMNSMVSDGIAKCLDGVTTGEEVRRVAIEI